MPDEYFDLKSRIHDRLLDMIDLSLIDKLEREALTLQIRKVIERILREEQFKLPLNMSEREKIFTEIVDEVLGYGPLEPMLKDPSVSDILVNSYKSIYVERNGKLEPTDARSSTRSSPRWAGASTSPPPWWMLACRTGRA